MRREAFLPYDLSDQIDGRDFLCGQIGQGLQVFYFVLQRSSLVLQQTADSFSDFLLGIKGFGHALFGRMTDIGTVISFIYEMSDQARKEGLLSLEGVLSIQAGENTRIIQEKIKAIINEDHET